MNILPFDKQVAVIAHLCEGNSIRSVERLTDIHRDTIMRLGKRVGDGCARLHDAMMRNLHVSMLQLDEAWSFVGKKQRRTSPAEADQGDQYIYIALDATNKAIISYTVGKRIAENTRAFPSDIYSRIRRSPRTGWNSTCRTSRKPSGSASITRCSSSGMRASPARMPRSGTLPAGS